MPAAGGGPGEARREVRNRLDRDAGDARQTLLLESAHLARETVELAVGGEHLDDAPGGQAGEDPVQQSVGVGRESDVLGPAQAEDARHVFLGRRIGLAEDLLPLAVGQARCVQPALLLGLEGHVRPEVVAMCGEVQALRVRLQESPKVLLCVQAPLWA